MTWREGDFRPVTFETGQSSIDRTLHERCSLGDHAEERMLLLPATTKSTSTIIGRDCPFQVDKITAEAGRTRVCLTISPAVRGSASVALGMHG